MNRDALDLSSVVTIVVTSVGFQQNIKSVSYLLSNKSIMQNVVLLLLWLFFPLYEIKRVVFFLFPKEECSKQEELCAAKNIFSMQLTWWVDMETQYGKPYYGAMGDETTRCYTGIGCWF